MNFDRLAPHYGWMEALSGRKVLQQARTAWLAQLHDRQAILSVGEGHGRFAEACTTRFPAIALTCVEASAGMLARAQARLGPSARIDWHHAELLSWTPRQKYDAVVTCFFLDCFPPNTLAEIIAKLAATTTDGAVWINVDFAMPPRGWKHWRARAVHALMYFFFRRIVKLPARRLTPPDDFLISHGFTLTGRREFNFGLVRADWWQRK